MIALFRRLAVFSAMLVIPAWAPLAAGDSEYGQFLSAECVTCHQPSGANDGIPSIIGWDEGSFIAVLKSYKAKERANPAMQLVTSNLGDEEMAALAAYFAKLGGERSKE